MNKLDLTIALKKKPNSLNPTLLQLLICFLMKWLMRLQSVTGLKFAVFVLLMSRNS